MKNASAVAKQFMISTQTIIDKLRLWGYPIRSTKKTAEEKAETIRIWHLNNPKKKKQYSRRSNRKLKIDVLSHYSNGIIKCARCGINDIDILCLDHINGNGENHRRKLGKQGNGLHIYWWLKNNNYPLGFQVLCLNCNWKKHLESA